MPLEDDQDQDYQGGSTASISLPSTSLLPPNATPIDAAIIRFESSGRNILQQVRPVEAIGGYTTRDTAGGYEQITDSTWRDFAPKAGVDLSQYPTAMSAPLATQIDVGHAIQAARGLSPWTKYDAPLSNYLASRGMGTGLMGPSVRPMASSGPVEAPNLQPLASRPAEAPSTPSLVMNLQSPGAPEPHQNPLALWSIIQAMTSGSHKFIPVDYDPWKIVGKSETS